MPRYIPMLLSFLLAVPCHAQQTVSPAVSPGVRSAMEGISIDRIWKHTEFLGNDRLRGRAVGTAGADTAARYLSEELRRMKIRPGSKDGTYLQRIPLHGSLALPGGTFQVSVGDTVHEFELFDDYLLYDTGDKTIIPQPVPLVFVGYGIVAPEFDYDDYQDVRVAGAVVVFLSGEPYSEEPDYFRGSQPTVHSLPGMKQRLALSRGAVGSIMIPSYREHGGRTWSEWQGMFAFEHVTLFYVEPSNMTMLVNPVRASLLFEGAAYSLGDVLEMDLSYEMRSFRLEAQIRFIGRFREREFFSSNVIGVLPGSDPVLREEYVIVSAHYDHLGVGPPVRADSIYNGVTDNALGCAGVLEIARGIAAMPEPPRRSLVFLFVTGEEKGLLGSRYYLDHPVIPLHRTMAAVNVDGLAIVDTFDDIIGVGADLSTLGELLGVVAGELGLTVSRIPLVFQGLDPFAQSDQIAFAQAGIPSILLMEGIQFRNLTTEAGIGIFVSWGRSRYHTPFDDLEQPINRAAVRQHVQVLLAYIGALADTYRPAQWVSPSRYNLERLRTIVEKR